MYDADLELLELIPQLAGHHVLVVGDLFLDEYWVGRATRLSREAPIPVLEFVRRFYVPGGAANPAHNICALGGQATAVGLIGDDPAGEQLLAELRQVGIDPSGVVLDRARPTTTKIRVMAEGSLLFPQQVARIDRLDRSRPHGQVEADLVKQIQRQVAVVDAVLMSDYQTAVATPAVVEAVLAGARLHRIRCTVDAQGSFEKYAGFNLIKANRHEVETALGRRLCSDEDFRRAGEELLDRLGAQAAVITRGADGLSLVTREDGCRHLPAANRSEVFDVTGAGDTIIAVVTLAWAAGASLWQAAQLANQAAGLVVRKLGNAVTSQVELRRVLESSSGDETRPQG